MPCALLIIIPVRKLEDENESIAFLSPYLGRHQTNQNVERTEQNRKSSRTNDKIGFQRQSVAHAQTLFSSVSSCVSVVPSFPVGWVIAPMKLSVSSSPHVQVVFVIDYAIRVMDIRQIGE